MMAVSCPVRIFVALLLLFAPTHGLHADESSGSPLIGWDTILDPDDDCKIKSTIIIKVPKADQNLNPTRNFSQPLNAPRLLKHVSGDFTAQVKVTGSFAPDAQNPGFMGAGLVIWEDETHFLRMERTAYFNGNEVTCEFPPIEHWRNGNFVGFPPKYPLASKHYKGNSTWLKIQRKDEKLIASVSQDGKEWQIVKEKKDLFPEDVSVGLAVVSHHRSELTFRFDDFDIQFH